MISYTDAQMEQERNDPKWLTVTGVEPNINKDLRIDLIRFDEPYNMGYGDSVGILPSMITWSTVDKYRLHNGPGYKDGIAIEQKADEWDGEALPPAGTVCEISPGKSDIWTEYKVIAYYGIHAWIVEAGSLEPGTCLPGSCKFRPIQSHKDKVIEAAAKVIQDYDGLDKLYDAGFLNIPEGDK